MSGRMRSTSVFGWFRRPHWLLQCVTLKRFLYFETLLDSLDKLAGRIFGKLTYQGSEFAHYSSMHRLFLSKLKDSVRREKRPLTVWTNYTGPCPHSFQQACQDRIFYHFFYLSFLCTVYKWLLFLWIVYCRAEKSATAYTFFRNERFYTSEVNILWWHLFLPGVICNHISKYIIYKMSR